jgi:hypothetical protein
LVPATVTLYVGMFLPTSFYTLAVLATVFAVTWAASRRYFRTHGWLVTAVRGDGPVVKAYALDEREAVDDVKARAGLPDMWERAPSPRRTEWYRPEPPAGCATPP